MPLQNRVDPFGAIHAVPSHGLFTGNRGVIHDPETRTLLKRRWTTKAWLICRCELQGRRRAVMGRNAPSGSAGWTELFFLDEVTALAAGHRPCFFCRRADAADFLARASATSPLRAPDLDARLHRERLAAGNPPRPITAREASNLPDGAVLASGSRSWAKRTGRFLPWSFEGYGAPASQASLPTPLHLLTPSPTIAALAGGYDPTWHPSATGRLRRIKHPSSPGGGEER